MPLRKGFHPRHVTFGVHALVCTSIAILSTLVHSQIIERELPADIFPAPTTQQSNRIRALIADLDAAEPEKRDEAFTALLNLSPSDLAAIRGLVRDGFANRPAQREALYDVVRHLYLVGAPPARQNKALSFFGMKVPRAVFDEDVAVGMSFSERLIGFPAFAAFREGDVILDAVEAPSLSLNSQDALADLRSNIPPGTTVHFHVLRGERIVQVALTLCPTPIFDEPGETGLFERVERAEQFWQTTFAPAFAGSAW